MERYVFPRIGQRPVSEVNTVDVLEILSPIWHVKAETARAVRQRVRSVLEWAVAMDLRNDNPCDRVVPVLGPQNDIVTHRQALAHKDVAAALETVRNGSAQPAVRLALEFPVLTAARSGEVRLATWDEIDTAGAVWTVPSTRMKAKREHRVPLCGRALAILDAARTLGGGNRLVFPMRSGRSIASSTFPKMLQYHEVAAVPHGFRSSFRDWAAELTDHPREVIEAALAHVIQNKVEAAYARSDLFERRRRLMNDWAAYLDGQADGSARRWSARRHGPPRGGDRGRPEDDDGLDSHFPEGQFRRERPPAMGVIREHPLRRKTTGFRGVAPGITGGATGSGLFLPEGAIRPATTGHSGAATWLARCDSGCDRGASTESHASVAN